MSRAKRPHKKKSHKKQVTPTFPKVQPQSFLECIQYFLTPQVWKQVLRDWNPKNALRWQPQPLLFVVLVMTWAAGDSQAERFETAKAFYVASYQKKRRPGKTLDGFQNALARVPARALRAVATALRDRLQAVFAPRWLVDGFVPLGCDGSRLNCPRSPELEQRLGTHSKKAKKAKPATTPPDAPSTLPKDPPAPPPADGPTEFPPTVFVTAFVHLSLGLLWSWRLGGAHASEQVHLVHLLATLPRLALIITDAGYTGYQLLQGISQKADRFFLIRLSSKSPLYTLERIAVQRFREGLAYYWPKDMQEAEQPPLKVRVLRLLGHRKKDVWLMTNVLESKRLSRKTASKFYRWRWRNEGLFRTYKGTFGKVKLLSHTVVQVHREAESSLLAVQLVLAHGLLALPEGGEAGSVLPSARAVLVEIRAELRNVTGAYLGPRQRRTYVERLQEAQCPRWRRQRHNQVRRPWPGRKDHKPPKPPKLRKMGTDLKKLLKKTLAMPAEGVDSGLGAILQVPEAENCLNR
jgi:Transposase DDE domain